MKSLRSLFASCLFLLLVATPVFACDQTQCESKKGDEEAYLGCLNDVRTCLEGKIAETQAQKETLNSTISVINNKISLQELSISQTLAEVTKLENDISLLGERIQTLNFSLDQLTAMLLKRVRERYKSSVTSPMTTIASSQTFSQAIASSRYVNEASQQTALIMRQAEIQKQLLDSQKEKKQQAQELLEEKKQLLVRQKQELASQRAAEQKLLEVTKNNERTYQQLLANAQAEINSFRNFSSSKTGGALPPQNSPDGWYFSQRDERWAGMRIANSSENIMEVGCLISSTAMIKKKFGENVSPMTIAANSGYFFASTAYMLRPWPAPSGYYYSSASFSSSLLDQKLAENPVIVKLSAGPYGTHFIVIKEKSGSDYIMHDPWEGYDKKFGDY